MASQIPPRWVRRWLRGEADTRGFLLLLALVMASLAIFAITRAIVTDCANGACGN
jgi:hypothetical protein